MTPPVPAREIKETVKETLPESLTPEKLSIQKPVSFKPALSPVPQGGKTKVVLAGNPNVGKSVFFNALTGRYVNVSNFPGTTVDIPRGEMDSNTQVQDTPGVYGLTSIGVNTSEEETVAEQAIMAADIVVNVVSAASLERDLFLTQQILDYGKPVIIALNLMDEAAAHQLDVHPEVLSKLMGVPVIPCVATKMDGIAELKSRLREARLGNRTPDAPEPEEIRLLEKDVAKGLHLYGLRRHHVNAVAAKVAQRREQDLALSKQISRSIGTLLLNPLVGLVVALLVLFSLYQIVGIWIAGDLVNLTEKGIMLRWIVPFMQHIIGAVVPVHSALYTVLAGEFGVLTMSVQYIYGVLFPLVLGFYIYISLLEDCGYLPRIAVLLDGALNKIGLNGRAVIPLILGIGCVTMATVSTRVLASNRERTIASTILAITIPCSAQLAVITGLMAQLGGIKGWAIYLSILLLILAILGSILNKLLPGRSTSLVLDLPPLRVPSFKNVARKTWIRTMVFLKEASPLFMLGSLLVAILQVSGLFVHIEAWLSPVTEKLLHLPGVSAQMFVMGMIRRDFGAAGLYFLAKQMTAVQMMTALMVITLFVPCIASATVIWKERGIKETTVVLLGSWALAFGVGAVLTRFLEVVHWL